MNIRLGYLLCLALLLAGCFEASSETRSKPRFQLSTSTQGVRVPAGGSAFVVVTLHRRDGFQGAVDLSLLGAPEGVQAQGRIEANATQVSLPVRIARELAPRHLAAAQIQGTSGHQTIRVPFRIEILAPLPPDSCSPDQVLASGALQTGSTIRNQAVVSEGAQAAVATAGTNHNRTGFHPAGLPIP